MLRTGSTQPAEAVQHNRRRNTRSRCREGRRPKRHGSFSDNLTLLLEIALGVGLLIGRGSRGSAISALTPGASRSSSFLNLAVIVFTMIPSFRVHVSPKIPLKLGKAYYALASAHAALGTITEIAGLCILLAAGTSFLPEKFRIANYKLWMRSVLILWWAVLLLGCATYARWYVPGFFRK